MTLAGCFKSGTSSSDQAVAVQGDVAIVYAKRVNTLSMNPTNGAPFAAGGDLIVREKSSPSAPEHNLTARFTQGVGDASDPEVSYDGKKIVFAMRCPASNTATLNGATACTGRWNIWEYDMTTGGFAGGTFRRLTSSTTDDDVDPYYLPAGRGFVFSSNRQSLTKTIVNGQAAFALDEYERERVLQLHTMNAQGGDIRQISVNQSHDRNPVVRANGDIMFSRWEHVGPRNRFAIFKAKPDGTDMFVLYGAQSPGNSFLHPREMDPASANKGKVSSSLMSLSGTQEGGGLMFIDVTNYSEHNTPANARRFPAQGGQVEVTEKALNMGRGVSRYGRVDDAVPAVGRHQPRAAVVHAVRGAPRRRRRVVRDAVATPRSSASTIATGRSPRRRPTRCRTTCPPSYAVYMYNQQQQTWLIVAAPPAGFMYTDPIALQPRAEPNAATPTTVDATLAAQNLALIEVRSVYDTDGLQRMGETMLAAADLPAGCAQGIAMTAPADPMDTRNAVADLVRMKDPANIAYQCSPARFVRAVRAVAPQANMMGMREAIGETEFEPQQILGYAPVEPDGSFKLLVPADTPLALSITDAKGRALQTHLNWIQVRPGERRTCDGCHSPRRGAALNSGLVVNTLPQALQAALASNHQSGETMASLRTRLDPALLNLTADMTFVDVWADTSKAGVTARASILVRYSGNASSTDDLATPAPVNGIINYPDHIQPLWTRDRGANTCTNCHADTAKLDLRATVAGTGRLVSYEELLLGDPVIDGATGRPVTRLEDGVPVVVRGAALVETMAGNAAGMTRSSRLGEILFGENLKASAEARTTHPNPPGTAPDHATLLNAAEKRLVTEWMDLGGQYFNNLSASNSPVRTASALSRTRVRRPGDADPAIELRGVPPAGRQQRRVADDDHVPAQPLRPDRRARGRLRRHAQHDLQHLPAGVELPAGAALDRSASVGRDDADDGRARRPAAATTTPSHAGSRTGCTP